MLYLATSDKLTFLAKEDIREYLYSFMDQIRLARQDILMDISSSGKFEDETVAKIDEYETQFRESYIYDHPEYKEED